MPAYDIVLEFSRAERADQPHAFAFVPQTYLLRTPGGGVESAEFPWTPELLADLQAVRRSARDPDAVHRIGAVLRGFLADAGWARHEPAILAAVREGAAVSVTLRSAAAELYALPWELLTLKSTGQPIGGIPGLVVRYQWPEIAIFPDRIAPGARRGRVLLAWSAAGGAVPAAEHIAAIAAACGERFDRARDVLAEVSLAALDRALDAAARGEAPPIDAVHLLCHGAAIAGTYGLALGDDAAPGAVAAVDAGRLQQIFAPHAGMVRLVVVAACDSGDSGELGNHLGSVAQMLHRSGIEAVVASRFPLSVAGSNTLAAAFYAALMREQGPLGRAFLAARDALLCDPTQLDWASVQLYGHADARPIWTPPAPPRPLAHLGSRRGLVFGVGGLAAALLAWSTLGGADEVASVPLEAAEVRRPGKCPGSLLGALRKHFQDTRKEGAIVEFSVQIQRDGDAIIRDVRGDTSLEPKAREQLARFDRGRLLELGGDALPCKLALTWLP